MKTTSVEAEQIEVQAAQTPARAYAPLPDVADEMVDTQGEVRPVWRHFLAALERMDEADLAGRFARADRYLRDAGVFYRAYGKEANSDRAWPLSHIPVLIDEAEWEDLARGLTQRAELLEAVVADIYGKNELVANGLLPPALVASNSEFLSPRRRAAAWPAFPALRLLRDRPWT